MKSIQSILFCLLLVFVFASCEGPKRFSVVVTDKFTKQPLDSVFVEVIVEAGGKEMKAYNLQGYTDSTGLFEREEMIGYGLSLKRWHFRMNYSKTGYVKKSEVDCVEGNVQMQSLK